MVYCNLCKWEGPGFNLESDVPRCPSCGSSNGNRSVFHVMGSLFMRPPAYEGLPLLAMNVGEQLGIHLCRDFNVAAHDLKGYDTGDRRLPFSDELFHYVIVCRDLEYLYYDRKLPLEIFRVMAVRGMYFSSVSVKPEHKVYKKRTNDGRWREYSALSYHQLIFEAGFSVRSFDLTMSDSLGSVVFVGTKETR